MNHASGLILAPYLIYESGGSDKFIGTRVRISVNRIGRNTMVATAGRDCNTIECLIECRLCRTHIAG